MERWKGFKEAKVWKKIKENDIIYSFYIKLADEVQGLPEYLPGQFIAVRVATEENTFSKPRQYTLSSVSNGEYYRISVKREEEGEVSKLLCDTVKEGDVIFMTAPAGNFVLKEKENPVVLIGGGIGITPMLTMAAAVSKKEKDIHLIYGLPNSEFMAFREEIRQLEKNNKRMKTTIAYSRPKEGDVFGRDYNKEGRLNKEWVDLNVDKNAEVYLCGPVEFMRTVYHSLIDVGVPSDRINYEMFQNGLDITK